MGLNGFTNIYARILLYFPFVPLLVLNSKKDRLCADEVATGHASYCFAFFFTCLDIFIGISSFSFFFLCVLIIYFISPSYNLP